MDGSSSADIRASERLMVGMRWLVAAWAFLQISVDQDAYPPGTKTWAYLLVAGLLVGNLAIYIASARSSQPQQAHRIAVASLMFDLCIAMSFVWLYAFEPSRSVWAVTFLIPVEGAARFQLRGMAWSSVGVVALYVLITIWGSSTYDYPLDVSSVTFRMGLVVLVGVLVGRLARQLQDQKDELAVALSDLERVDGWRSRLVQMLAHDVRGPLGTIDSTVQLLLAREAELDPATQRRLLEAIARQSARVQHLALDLLDLARIENASLQLQPQAFDLRELVENATGLVSASADEIAIEASGQVPVVADRQRIEQVYVNLLANALAHGEPPVRVTVSSDGQTAELAVRDGGGGVPPELQTELFRAFSASTAAGSVGLGLWMSRMLTEAHGGTLQYLREDGETVFLARFPTGAASPSTDHALFEAEATT